MCTARALILTFQDAIRRVLLKKAEIMAPMLGVVGKERTTVEGSSLEPEKTEYYSNLIKF
jgi:hypothetical protein